MNIIEYRKMENKIYEEYRQKLHKLRTDYVENNKKFNIGDFIGNVTGIIKVERIGYRIFMEDESIEIIYYGYRYKKFKGNLCRTKNNNISHLWESHNLELIPYNLQKIE